MQLEEQQAKTGISLALGNFDGLHRGHAAVLAAAKQQADNDRLTPAVLLFDEHPKQVLTGEAPPLLMTAEEKRERLARAGFSVLTLSFRETKDLLPEAFLRLLQTEYDVRALSCGENYRFGKGAVGTAETLQTLCPRFCLSLTVVPEETYRGSVISSTRIRRAIERGAMEDANAMLLRPYSYRLPVVSGDRRGRLLGFPTINQFFLPRMIRPRAGVYASKVALNDMWYPAVTNIGVRPTVGGSTFRSETCILGFSGDLYGCLVEVAPLHYLREEKKFEDFAALQAAMEQDAAQAREVLKTHAKANETEDQSGLL